MEINIHEKELWVKLVIYKDYTEVLHGQQNIKSWRGFQKQSLSTAVTTTRDYITDFF